MRNRFFNPRHNQALLATLSMMSLLLLPVSFVSAQENENGKEKENVELQTSLSGPEIHGMEPNGEAVYTANSEQAKFIVSVEHIPAEEGPLEVTWVSRSTGASTVVGQIRLSKSGRGQLVLSTRAGDSVPQIEKGDMLIINGTDDSSVGTEGSDPTTPDAFDDLRIAVGVF